MCPSLYFVSADTVVKWRMLLFLAHEPLAMELVRTRIRISVPAAHRFTHVGADSYLNMDCIGTTLTQAPA
ncbi:hypothetical protein BV25DRAFT_1829155, partial [Artomyces pyxidatus]